MTNVRYKPNGISSSELSSSTATMTAMPCARGLVKVACQKSVIHCIPPPKVNASSNNASNSTLSMPKRVLALV